MQRVNISIITPYISTEFTIWKQDELHGMGDFPKKLIAIHQVQTFPSFMELEGSAPLLEHPKSVQTRWNLHKFSSEDEEIIPLYKLP